MYISAQMTYFVIAKPALLVPHPRPQAGRSLACSLLSAKAHAFEHGAEVAFNHAVWLLLKLIFGQNLIERLPSYVSHFWPVCPLASSMCFIRPYAYQVLICARPSFYF